MSWPYAYTPSIWPMLASAIFLAGLAIYAWKHRTVPGAGPFAIQMLLCALWALFTTLEIAATSEPTKTLGYRLGRMMAPPAMTALLVFALKYARPSQQATRRIVLVLSGLVLFILALLATNDLHHLYWTRVWFDGYIRVDRGPLGLALLGYVLLLPTLALVIFLRLAWRARGIYRTQALLLFAGNALPLLAFLLEPAGINPVAPLNPTILMLNATGLLFTVAIYRFGMLGVIPIGRDTAVERMADGMLILDAEDRIVDLNPAAQAALALSRPGAIGHAAWQCLSAYPDLASFLKAEGVAEAEVQVKAASQVRYYQAHLSPLVDQGGFKLGRLMALKEVTEHKRAQAQLVEQQRALAAAQEGERLGRELHDNHGQVLGYVKMKVHLAREALAEEERAAVDRHLAQLEKVVQESHTDVRDYLLGWHTQPPGEIGFVAALRDYLSRFAKTFQIETELQVSAGMTDSALDPPAQVQLLRIVQEALTNTRKHAAARRVCVSAAVTEGAARIVVEDDGCGFEARPTAEGAGPHYGLGLMRERAAEVGGSVAIDSAPGRGTRVIVEIPVRA
ncbi:MAG: histidine kinase N-terminal 7TM domain-containing protein [Rudaea sp.]